MPADWFCDIEGTEHGPLNAGQLKKLAVLGKLKPTHMVWKQGMLIRVPAQTVKGLFGPAPIKKEEELIEFEMVEADDGGDLVEIEMIAEVEEVEVIEDRPPSKPRAQKKPEKKEPVEVVAEGQIIYREGLPGIEAENEEAELVVESKGLRFLFEEEEFFVTFEKVESVLEPAKGDFSPSMKKKAVASKAAGVAGKIAAGLLGRMVGGDAGNLVEKAGGAAGDMASKGGELGKPPRNRIAFYATLRKERCKVVFDANGSDRDDMNETARSLYKAIEKARKKAASEPVEAEGNTTNINVTINEGNVSKEAPRSSAAPTTPRGSLLSGLTGGGGKAFRVMRGGRTQGPYSADEVCAMLSSGKISGSDMIGVETWLPAATLGGLLGASPRAGSNGTHPTPSAEEEVEEYGDYEEVEEEETPASKMASLSDGDAIPVEDEFKI